MEVFQSSLSGIPLFRVVGDVDHFTAPALEAAGRTVLAADGEHLLFDLSAVPDIDSGGTGVILALGRDIRPSGWLGVIGAGANLLRVFAIVGLISQPGFRVFARLGDATKTLGDAPT
jgi:anti-anti-sigma regulatory factor